MSVAEHLAFSGCVSETIADLDSGGSFDGEVPAVFYFAQKKR
jgi:hypothetical protein